MVPDLDTSDLVKAIEAATALVKMSYRGTEKGRKDVKRALRNLNDELLRAEMAGFKYERE